MSQHSSWWTSTRTNQDDYNIPQFDNVNDQSYEFSLGIINCCSVCNKQSEIEALIGYHKFDFIIDPESHLDDSVLNAEVFPSHYTVYRQNRSRYVAGVFILAKHNIPLSFLQSSSSVELIWVRVHLKRTQDIILGCFYCPPMAHTESPC